MQYLCLSVVQAAGFVTFCVDFNVRYSVLCLAQAAAAGRAIYFAYISMRGTSGAFGGGSCYLFHGHKIE